MRPIRDQSGLFALGFTVLWLVAVAVPITASVEASRPLKGLPLLGVIVWFGVLRLARRLSPAAHVNVLIRNGKYAEALALCERALSVTGQGTWTGTRRLVWLNRRTTALLALGRPEDALTSALEAVAAWSDPETLANCAQALLNLNRYEEAGATARLALSLTRHRSLTAHVVLANVMLAQGRPAEAEALAYASLTDARALFPLVRTDNYVACLATLWRARRAQGRNREVAALVEDLQRTTRKSPYLRAIALVEQADALADTPENRTTALSMLAEALELAPYYVYWFMTQPGTFAWLREDPRFTPALATATTRVAQSPTPVPSVEVVALELATAQKVARSRPAPQSSRQALAVQVVTLAGTLALLMWWTWRFFLMGM